MALERLLPAMEIHLELLLHHHWIYGNPGAFHTAKVGVTHVVKNSRSEYFRFG